MRTVEIMSGTGASGERLMDDLDYGFCNSELSNTGNMESSVSNVLGDEEYSNIAIKRAKDSDCGKRPISKKKRAAWQKCINDRNAANAASVASTIAATPPSPATAPLIGSMDLGASNSGTTTPVDDTIMGLSKPLFYGIVGVTTLVAGIIVYKKFIAKS